MIGENPSFARITKPAMWDQLADVPTEIRTTMASAFNGWEKQDLSVESVVDAMIQSPDVTRATVRTLQASANRVRIPDLVRIVKTAHPRLSWRSTFRAVALFCGLHHKNVQKIYYGIYWSDK